MTMDEMLEVQEMHDNLMDQLAETQRLSFEWQKKHDHLLGFIQKQHPELLGELVEYDKQHGGANGNDGTSA